MTTPSDRLGPLVDGILSHDRPIHIRCDDSVVRGPAPVGPRCCAGPGASPPSRSTYRSRLGARSWPWAQSSRARWRWPRATHWWWPATTFGDLEHLATYQSFLQALDHLCRLCGVSPEVVAHDLHPGVPLDQAGRGARPADGRRAAPPRPHRLVPGRPRPHRPGTRRRLRRPRLRHRRDAVGRRVPRRRSRRAPSGSVTFSRPLARRDGGHPRAVAHGGGLAARQLAGRPSPLEPARRLDARAATVVAVLAGSSRRCASPPAWAGCSTRWPAVVCGRSTGQLRGPGGHRARSAGRAPCHPARVLPIRSSARWDGGQLVIDPTPLMALGGRRHDRRPAPRGRSPRPSTKASAVATVEGPEPSGRHRGLATVVLTGGVFQNARLPRSDRGRAAGLRIRGAGAPHRAPQRRWDQHRPGGGGGGVLRLVAPVPDEWVSPTDGKPTHCHAPPGGGASSVRAGRARSSTWGVGSGDCDRRDSDPCPVDQRRARAVTVTRSP